MSSEMVHRTTESASTPIGHLSVEGALPPGLICTDCGERFFYDFLDKPEQHEGSGMCWLCFAYKKMERRA